LWYVFSKTVAKSCALFTYTDSITLLKLGPSSITLSASSAPAAYIAKSSSCLKAIGLASKVPFWG